MIAVSNLSFNEKMKITDFTYFNYQWVDDLLNSGNQRRGIGLDSQRWRSSIGHMILNIVSLWPKIDNKNRKTIEKWNSDGVFLDPTRRLPLLSSLEYNCSPSLPENPVQQALCCHLADEYLRWYLRGQNNFCFDFVNFFLWLWITSYFV